MKKLPVVLLVVGFLVMWSGCGGGSKKTLLPEKTVQPEATRTTVVSPPVAKATSNKGEQTVDVSGKGCPADITIVTSKDLAEAVINTVCGLAQKLEDHTGKKPEGIIQFISLKTIQTGGDAGEDTSVVFSFKDCADCPRDFEWQWRFSKNPLGEWQAVEIPTYGWGPKETRSSIADKEARDTAKTAQAESGIFSGIKIEVLTTSGVLEFGDTLQRIQLQIEGAPKVIYLLGRLEDGRAVEFKNDARKEIQPNATAEFNFFALATQTDSVSPTVQVIAYSYQVGENRSDWVYLNK